MKKELFAGAFLLALLAAVLINNYFLGNISEELQSLIADTEYYAASGNWNDAAKTAEKALECWTSSDKYTHIVLRHTEIDAATDVLCELLTAAYQKDAATLAGSARQASFKLRSIIEIEKLRPGSIF